MRQTYTFRIQRYAPPEGASLPQAPDFQDFTLKMKGPLTVLEALNRIKAEQEGSLSYRWSCRMGICGSCGMVINGRPQLACSVYCHDAADSEGRIVVEPMRNMPILKDLIVDIDDPMNKMRGVMPYIDFQEKEPELGRQSKRERGRIEKTSQCVKCMLCYSACSVYGQEKSFVGPAAGALAYRYMADSRDDKGAKRVDRLVGESDGVWGCSFIGACSKACPKRVDPAQALQRLKVMGALRLATKPVSDFIRDRDGS